MYLLIHEDGSLQTATELAEDVFKAADDGYIDVVDVTGEVPFQYLRNEWHKIDGVEEFMKDRGEHDGSK